jgi:4-hydroxy-tetrahydrodipicolinate reductase
MIRVIVAGAAGRMGSQLIRAVRDAEGVELVGATERPGAAAIGLDAGLAAGLGMLEVQVQDSLDRAIEKAGGKVDVVIDFTTAEASLAHALVAAEHRIALVVGSTGFSNEAREAVTAAASNIPVVMAPNMSIGVNLLVKIAAEVAEDLGPDYEVEILEMHHRHKIDAPSGTAVRLAEVIAEKLGRPARDILYARHGSIGERPHDQIGVQALRGGDVVGEHTVYFIGEGERIELTHRAWSRDQFATGAVRAARWVVGKPAGLYSMRDVLAS